VQSGNGARGDLGSLQSLVSDVAAKPPIAPVGSARTSRSELGITTREGALRRALIRLFRAAATFFGSQFEPAGMDPTRKS